MTIRYFPCLIETPIKACACLAILLFVAPAFAADDLQDWARMKSITPRNYVCPRVLAPIQVDGRLDDPAWKTAPWTEEFVDIEGAAKPKPRFRTRAKMLWDSQYFYVAAELEEPHLWATLTNHDAVIFQDPDFEVFIDPDGDTHDYYEFEINALNTGWDLLLKKTYKDGGPALNEWEIPGLKTAVNLDGTLNKPSDRDRGWTVEIAFPWKALAEFARRPAPPADGDQWRVGFSRVQWSIEIRDGKYQKVPNRKEDNWVWSPQGIIDMHRPEKWGYVQFTTSTNTVPFRPDPSAAARSVLQEVYYAQKSFRKKQGDWARSLKELGLPPGLGADLVQPPVIEKISAGYQATVLYRDGQAIKRCRVRQDGRVVIDR